MIQKRKEEHLGLALSNSATFTTRTTLLECVELEYNCMPELALGDVCLHTRFLNHQLHAPLMVSALTGGIKRAGDINRDIAMACQTLGIAMQLGSQRAMIEQPALADSFQVRDVAPDILLIGNIGACQLLEFSINELRSALDAVEANALAVHLNAAQEAVQGEDSVDFCGVFKAIKRIASKLGAPVMVKEVGHGISGSVASKLASTKIAAVDVQGAGGTNWIAIEAKRKNKHLDRELLNFGIPTALSIIECRSAFPREIVGSGGIRSPMDAAKALVLGADLVGLAGPVLSAQRRAGYKGVLRFLQDFMEELQLVMFLCGARSVQEMKRKPYRLTGKLKELVEQSTYT
jgi:isopentenyl-diphosphate delta-isomerase